MGLEDEKVQAYFQALGLDINASWDIFRLLDRDQNRTVDIEEFAWGCLRLRGPARNVDVASIQYEVKQLLQKLTYFMAFVEAQFEAVFASTPVHHEDSANGAAGSSWQREAKSHSGYLLDDD